MHSLANIVGLLVLIMYIYSIIGMIFLGEVKRNASINDYINFENFTSAFITLFTPATVDSWNFTAASFAWARSPINNCIENPTYSDYEANNFKTIGCGDKTLMFAFL